MNKKVAVLLVVTNEEKHLKLFFTSLLAQTFKNIKVYILNNNSVNNSVVLIKKLWTEAHIVQKNENTGFAKGNNIIAKIAVKDGCDYLFVLNPDIELDTDCINELIKLIESKNDAGAVAPVCFIGGKDKEKNKIQCYGDKGDFKKRKYEQLYSNQYFDPVKFPEIIEVNMISGGVTFIKSSVFKEIGLFDEIYFMYGEEIDLGYRMYKAGFKMFVTHKAKVWHHHDWSEKKKKYFMYYYTRRNQFLYFRKHNFYKQLVFKALLEFFYLPLKIFVAIKKNDLKALKYYYLGVFDGLKNKSGKKNIEFV